MAKGELGKIFEVLAEDAIKAGRNTAERMENFTRDTVQRVRQAAEDAQKIDRDAADKITKAGGKGGGDDVPGAVPGVGAWPPAGPVGPKPEFGQPGAAEWRYQRYLDKAYGKGKGPDDVMPFDEWKTKHYDQAAAGNRPGRRGGPEQVAAKEYLTANHGVQEVENVNLGGQYPDGIRSNAAGGTDYFEVGGTTKGGLPEIRERLKLANEVPALGPNDTLHFVDKNNPDESQWWTYNTGDDPHTKYR